MKKTTRRTAGGRGGAGSHELYQRVKKKAGTIKASSRRWLERHLNDPYVHQSKADGYRSRAAYKLIEINERYKILKKGQKIIDLGAAPGGWCQVAARLVESKDYNPSVVGIDYLHMEPLPGVAILEMDFFREDAPQELISTLGSKPDVVLSDMAAPTTGHRQTDHLRTIALCEAAVHFSISVLKPGGHFLTKTFQGGAEGTLLATLKQNFKKVHHVKPPASRAESVELYLLALQFKGKTD
ncbi:ribosomal RNA large subunit methyltransferase E [Bartonella bacilliformis str. Heidi Mejia]|uniref:RlmE family RNA methyltransferase n=1 Tax=Bartonella bacilliformis TaxID=774 RepID=UPI0004500E40|nr:RlmE family RNA methyltransferase [Bartonella bacilliformis]EYS92392.1 ribosomal RNA large subunit methyltransferase E [Bartonella bacilliformis str. Heidi Mejia]KEG18537.1 ribosomal RNA large subunit methyltransferase E [Bartonella bacilliformis Hosp800-02]KEG23994.1 ribosomal RNA large subunit methyltransferase E [Bartonella bacilliformis CAR600-02]